MTSRLMLAYAEREGGQEAVDQVLAHAGRQGREAELRDENTWFSLATKVRLFEGLCLALDDPEAVRRAGESALDLSVGEGLRITLRALGSPALVYRNIVRANAKFSAIHTLELLELGRDHATVAFSDNVGYDVHPLDCDYTRGLLSVVPRLFGLPAARVAHPSCAARGGERCVYEVHWAGRAVTPRAWIGTGALGTAALAASALAAPALVPVAGAAGAAALAVLAARTARAGSLSRRHLERELAHRDDVVRRITASLEDLVTELDLDEVLAKIVGNASAAVGSKEFALLVAEDGALRSRASSGVPAAALERIVAWVAAHHADDTDVVLVEDVRVVEELAPLRDAPQAPYGSVCLAPLVNRGATVGHLVALAPQARTFLPRDLDLVRSYAIPAAIALANARHFAAQRALATRDPLTGLLNHREFHESVERELERARRHGGHVSVALFDLDGFKLVNDGAGHAEGDRVLRAVADAMGAACRASDLVFRVGGDEFALLLPLTGREEAKGIANRVRRAIGAVDARVGASIGMATWPEDGGSKDVLLASADALLYAMKGSSRDRRVVPARRAAGGASEPVGPRLRERLGMVGGLAARLAELADDEAIVRAAVDELQHRFGYTLASVHRHDGRATEEHDGSPGSVLEVPLCVGPRTWGVLSVQDTERDAYGSDDVLLLELVAAQTAAALHRAALVTELGRLEN